MNSKKYDLIVVGSGIYGATIAQQALEHGLRCLVVERREQVGGNVRDEWHERICVHQYGAHIFHTNHKNVWEYVNRFATFIPYYHKVMARSGNKMYHLPFSLQTFYEIFGISNPSQIDEVLQDEHKREFYIKPANFEEQAINLIGRTLYDLFVKGYTEKQWGCDPRKLSNNLIQRIPIHLNWNCDYFDDYYQGLPEKGYSEIIKGMLKGIEVKTGVDFINPHCS